MRINKQDVIRISGTGPSKEHAFASAFGSIQKEVVKNSGKIMLQINPVDVEIVEAQELTYTEKFLFFFFRRERSKYHVVLDVTIDMTYIDQETIRFDQVNPKTGVVDKVLNRPTGV